MVFVDGEIKSQFFVQLVATDQTKVVAAGVKEHLVKKIFGIFNNGWFAGADLVIEFKKSFIGGLAGILEEGGFNILMIDIGIDFFEEISDLIIVFVTEGAEKRSAGNFSMAVDPN